MKAAAQAIALTALAAIPNHGEARFVQPDFKDSAADKTRQDNHYCSCMTRMLDLQERRHHTSDSELITLSAAINPCAAYMPP